MADPLMPIRELQILMDYNPETGVLTWKEKPLGLAGTLRKKRFWDTKYAGKRAFTATNSDGYSHGELGGRSLLAHRVAWAVYHGVWPLFIDHINGVRTDNRIVNLRSVTRGENMRNQKLSVANASGRIGVKAKGSAWEATIKSNNRTWTLGTFNTFAEACAAREAAEIVLDFHPNHGAHNAQSAIAAFERRASSCGRGTMAADMTKRE